MAQPAVAIGNAVPFLFDLPLTFDLAFPCNVQLDLPFLGFAALAQCGGTVCEGVGVDPGRRLAQPRLVRALLPRPARVRGPPPTLPAGNHPARADGTSGRVAGGRRRTVQTEHLQA